MKKFEIITPCHFGMEAVLKKEIINLGYDITSVDDGRVTFFGDEDAVARANIFLRTAERVLICVGSFMAESFEELFQGTKALPWEEYIPKDGKFWVAKASSVKSKLFSPSDIQSIMKKAMVEKLKEKYGISWFTEDGESYPLRVFIKKDMVTVGLDTTGDSLHKRGYRKLTAKAPIAENLAAGLLMLTGWRERWPVFDPFCGSGTFPIEAAMLGANIAPGAKRHFTAESWKNLVPKALWKDCRIEAQDEVIPLTESDIAGYDMAPEMVRISRENARLAGVGKYVRFEVRDAAKSFHEAKRGVIITNPPYGERLMDKSELPQLYKGFGAALKELPEWDKYLITSYEDVQKSLGMKAKKNRKIYNGMMKTYFYSF